MDDPNLNTDFTKLRKDKIRPLIELNDKINLLTSQERSINSTRIVVAGDQSHGKTSLLEALSGIDLPRGEGIQTRVPLILKLRRSKANEQQYVSIKVASSNEEGEHIRVCDIGDKVREYTVKVAGPGKDVRDVPIELSVYRADQEDLTLIDLPGITRVALEDQAGGDGKKLEALILKLCRRYMKPDQSILLNVVSAMVDFSTSASLQLSRELDPEGLRTMMCITKIDQHAREGGLHGKITKMMKSMNLDSDHVFAVRNRTQKENDENLSLVEARLLEQSHIDGMFGEKADGQYGLGVLALSKKLVETQHNQILKTLPNTKASIDEQFDDLQFELQQLGESVGDANECRIKALSLIDTLMMKLEKEWTGRDEVLRKKARRSNEGESFEISTQTLVEKERISHQIGSYIESDCIVVGDYAFSLKVYPNGTIDHTSKDKSKYNPIGIYLHMNKKPSWLKSTTISGELCAYPEKGETVASCSFKQSFEEGSGRGYGNFISGNIAQNLKGLITFRAMVVISAEESSTNIHSPLLCGQLCKLDDELVSNIDSIHSNQYFFSEAFRLSLQHQVETYRGSIGMPGTIAPHIPLSALRRLRKDLPKYIEKYRQAICNVCRNTIWDAIDEIEQEKCPNLIILFQKVVKKLLEDHAILTQKNHEYLLSLEEVVCTSNHYFMDTIQSIRSDLFDTNNESDKVSEKNPFYRSKLTATKMKSMSNEEQKLVDMQIEIFAYWKLMKTRLIDYVIMAARSELVIKVFRKTLKSSLVEGVMSYDEDEVVKLLSPNAAIIQKRNSIIDRSKKLKEAQQLINNAHFLT